MDAVAGCPDCRDCLLTVTGPGRDVPEGILTRVDPKSFTDDVSRGLSFELGKRPVVAIFVEQGVS